MNDVLFKEFKPVTDIALQRQITNFLRDAVRTGKLKPGDKIPPLRSLAENWKTNYFTVNSALKTLVSEGVMTRQPRVGTFVKAHTVQLDKVGVYFGGEPFLSHEGAFYTIVQHSLQEHLSIRGAQNMTFWDGRSTDEQVEVLPELMDAIRDGKITCLIAPLVNRYIMRGLKKLSIPMVVLTDSSEPFVIRHNSRYEMEQVFKRFRELKVNSVGLITNTVGLLNGDGEPNFTAKFKKAAIDNDFELRDEWIISPEDDCDSMVKFGYKSFLDFWKQPEKPDGLYITTDIVGMGCVNAILKQGVKVPQELKIIMHRNQEIDIFTPFPVDWVVNSAQKTAETMIEKLETEMQGKKAYNKRLVYRIVRNIPVE